MKVVSEMSMLSDNFIDVFERSERKVADVEIADDVTLEKMFSACLSQGHSVFKHSKSTDMSYGHLCKTCKRYFHRHMCPSGRGSMMGV